MAVVECIQRRDRVAVLSGQQQHQATTSLPSKRMDTRDRGVQSTLLGVKVRITAKKARPSSNGGDRTSSGGESQSGEKRQLSLVHFLTGRRDGADSGAVKSTEGEECAEVTSSNTTMAALSAPSMLWQSSEDENGDPASRLSSKRKHSGHDESQIEGSAEKKRKEHTSSKRRGLTKTRRVPSTGHLRTSSIYDAPPGASSSSKSSALTSARSDNSDAEATQALSWNGEGEDEPPQLRSPRKRMTPDRKIARCKRRPPFYAPAISPKKKKALIEQSVKDSATQQARRSKGPLQAIDNLSPPPLGRGKDNTPSPLRAGFSLIQLDHGIVDDSSETEDEDDPPSPLRERGASPGKRRQLQSIPKQPRIYAYETQGKGGSHEGGDALDALDPLLRTLNDPYESQSAPSLKKASPDAGSTLCNANGEAPALPHCSSQTAPGGSWPTAAHAMDHEVADGASVEERRAGVPGWRTSKRRPSSSSLYEDIGPSVMTSPRRSLQNEDIVTLAQGRKSTLLSGVQATDDRHVSNLIGEDDELPALDTLAQLTSLHLLGDETQPLPWEANNGEHDQTSAEEQQREKATQAASETQASSLPRRRRAPQDWVNLNGVWSAHLYDNVPVPSASSSTRKGQQSQLATFGFSRTSKKKPLEQPPMSDAEEVSSSDEDAGDHGDTTVHGACPSAPESSQAAMSIPSDSGLNSQVRNFFDVL